jgi:hypothetical protein
MAASDSLKGLCAMPFTLRPFSPVSILSLAGIPRPADIALVGGRYA